MPIMALVWWPEDWVYFWCSVGLVFYFILFSLAHLSALYMSTFWLYKDVDKDLGDDEYPPVSILKPLAGADANLKCNLETFFTLEYPKYEILFCIQSTSDPSLKVVEDLRQSYPHVDVSVLTGGEDVGVNPKISNMLQGYPLVKYDTLWISDSGCLATPRTLTELVYHLKSSPNVGLVHQIPYWAAKPDFAGCVSHVYFGTQHGRMYLAANFLRQTCAGGASMLTKKSVLESVGGLEHFGQYLAEDFFLAKNIYEKGYVVKMSTLPVFQNPAEYSVKTLMRRLRRWAQLRTAMIPFPTLLEPLTECLLLGFLASLCARYVMGIPFIIFYAAHISVWMTFDFFLLRNLQNSTVLHLRNLFFAWWLRELISLPVFIQGVCARHVTWKGKVYKLQWGGTVQRSSRVVTL